MRIVYFCDTKNFITGEIAEALRKSNKVGVFDENDCGVKEVVKAANVSDLFLFHKGGIKTTIPLEYQLSLTRLQNILDQIKCKKAVWFLEKMWGMNTQLIDEMLPFVDKAFLVDETFVRRCKEEKFIPLHPGCELKNGNFDPNLVSDIAFAGEIYGLRSIFTNPIKQQYGRKFKIYNDVFDNFADLCVSAKIMFIPKFPQNEFYWNNRIYQILACGGFVVSPELQGLKDEGFINGKHYITYSSVDNLLFSLDYFLKPEAEEARKKIAENGKSFVAQFTWETRLKTLLDNI